MNREPMSCEEALRLLAAHLDAELETTGAGELQRHLERCRSCYSRAEFERRLKEAVAALGCENAGATLQQRIRHLVTSFPTADG
jgi:mycothiol system anti-sigma-R factor